MPVHEIARTFGVDWPHLAAQAVSFSIVACVSGEIGGLAKRTWFWAMWRRGCGLKPALHAGFGRVGQTNLILGFRRGAKSGTGRPRKWHCAKRTIHRFSVLGSGGEGNVEGEKNAGAGQGDGAPAPCVMK